MVEVRAATSVDFPAVLELMAELRRSHHDPVGGDLRGGGAAWTTGRFARRMRDPWARLLVAESGSTVVGYISVRLEPVSSAEALRMLLARRVPVDLRGLRPGRAPTRRPRTAFVDELVVSPSVRRQGTGAALGSAALAWCSALGVRTVALEVHDGNEGAIELYRGFGFEITRRRMVKVLGPSANVRPRVRPASRPEAPTPVNGAGPGEDAGRPCS